MLEFIVLGQVPGTHIFISFTQALALWVGVFLLTHTLLRYRRYQKSLTSAEQAAALLAVIRQNRKPVQK